MDPWDCGTGFLAQDERANTKRWISMSTDRKIVAMSLTDTNVRYLAERLLEFKHIDDAECMELYSTSVGDGVGIFKLTPGKRFPYAIKTTDGSVIFCSTYDVECNIRADVMAVNIYAHYDGQITAVTGYMVNMNDLESYQLTTSY